MDACRDWQQVIAYATDRQANTTWRIEQRRDGTLSGIHKGESYSWPSYEEMLAAVRTADDRDSYHSWTFVFTNRDNPDVKDIVGLRVENGRITKVIAPGRSE
jgi:hypothetical protein